MNGRSTNGYAKVDQERKGCLSAVQETSHEIAKETTLEGHEVGRLSKPTATVFSLTRKRVEDLLAGLDYNFSNKWKQILADFLDRLVENSESNIRSELPNLGDPFEAVKDFLREINPTLEQLDNITFNSNSYFTAINQIERDLNSEEPEKVIERLRSKPLGARLLAKIDKNYEGLNLKGLVRKYYESVDLVPSLRGGEHGSIVTLYFEFVEK